MARRATLLSRVKGELAGDGGLLQVAGPYEFMEPGDAAAPEGSLAPMAEALTRLSPDILCLAPEESTLLSRAGIVPPDSAVVLGPAPVTRIITRGGVRIGLVFFPIPAKPGEKVEDKARSATIRAARELRGQADLLVGISPWGSMAEEAFLSANPDLLDVLLGGGPGFGTPAAPQPVPGTLWARSHTKGKTVNRLDIPLPLKKTAVPWTPGENHHSELLNPDYTVPGDPAIQALDPATPSMAAAPVK
ncbi:hypothetical protein GD605_11640 [Desulfolutivibrio sulfoxidireducens]|nr:hypothetical protein [Desulfolutivibrio sulfoxidireducens]QLA16715.1 hypothetical protein GD605_11640 [Desulfolutivibrio sulfoxidireducens]